ncbi:MAG: VWA domain-containing protein [Acidobacteria bacterium]|nr:VWA domain-containing protein [Acidobacteriota bacterium]
MTFANPEILYALILVLLLPIVFIRSETKRRALLTSMIASDKPGLVMGAGFERRLVAMVLLCLGIAALVAAAARPQWGTKLEAITHRGIDILVAIDVSESMRARDVSPDRISKARQEVEKFLELLKGDRVGLIAFAGSAYNYCPLTVDYRAIRLFLSGLEPGVIEDSGTNLNSAIAEGIKTFERSKSSSYRVLVLFTDGEHHEQDPLPAVREAVDAGIQVYTVGIGNPSTSGERIPLDKKGQEEVFKLDQAGNLVITKLDEATLQSIAEEGNGQYYRVSQAGTELVEIYKQLSAMEQTEFSSRLHHQKEERFQIPLLGAFVCLVLAFSLSDRSFRKLRRTQGVRI